MCLVMGGGRQKDFVPYPDIDKPMGGDLTLGGTLKTDAKRYTPGQDQSKDG